MNHKLSPYYLKINSFSFFQNLTTRPLAHHSASPVECMTPFHGGVLVGRHDGLCQYYNLDGTSSYQLTGSDCDPIYRIAVDSEHMYTACRDGMIRKYRSRDITA